MTKYALHRAGHYGFSSGDFALSGVKPQYAPDLPLEPKHLELNLAVHLDERSIDGRATWTVLSRRSNAQTLRLNAIDLDIHSVTDPAGSALTWRIDHEHLEIRWPKYRLRAPSIPCTSNGRSQPRRLVCISARLPQILTARSRGWQPTTKQNEHGIGFQHR